MDAYLSIVSKRDVRRYRSETISKEGLERILQAGRLSGSAYNDMPWLFLAISTSQLLHELAPLVNRPENIESATVAVVIAISVGVATAPFDADRAAQNMMLAAWNAGIASTPNYVRDQAGLRALLPIPADFKAASILTFGFPISTSDPETGDAESWIGNADRKELDDVARFL